MVSEGEEEVGLDESGGIVDLEYDLAMSLLRVTTGKRKTLEQVVSVFL